MRKPISRIFIRLLVPLVFLLCTYQFLVVGNLKIWDFGAENSTRTLVSGKIITSFSFYKGGGWNAIVSQRIYLRNKFFIWPVSSDYIELVEAMNDIPAILVDEDLYLYIPSNKVFVYFKGDKLELTTEKIHVFNDFSNFRKVIIYYGGHPSVGWKMKNKYDDKTKGYTAKNIVE